MHATSFDAIVAGGGIVGTAAAGMLAGAGWRVLFLEDREEASAGPRWISGVPGRAFDDARVAADLAERLGRPQEGAGARAQGARSRARKGAGRGAQRQTSLTKASAPAVVGRWSLLASVLLSAHSARADDAARSSAHNPFAMGTQIGVAMPQPLGNGRPGLAGSLGLAPTAALEMSFRLGDHYSVGGLIGAGLGTGEACRNAAVSRSCQVPLLGLFGGFVRYHSVPARGFEPWVAAGLASSALRGPGLGPDVRPQTSVGRGTLERVSATELGVELSVGAGTSWRVSSTVSVGLALNALAGPNVYARETRTYTRTYSQGAEDTRSLPLSGVHGIFFAGLHLQFHTPN